MKVCLIQHDIAWGDPQANCVHLDGLLATAPQADLYVLPEMFTTGFATLPDATVEHDPSAGLRWMQAKAAELGLRTAEFYSCSGLPIFTRSALAAKLQNRMSAQDLFLLIRALLEKHPEITEITSKKYSKMQKLDYATANSNPLVFNLDGVNGLKTGNTDKAGNCLAVSLPVSHGGETHTIVLVLLGAENAWVRNQASEILLRYAQNYYGENGF